MANCPNCGRKLHLTDWRPNCPDCGVNLNYFRANDILIDEAEKAEVEHARFQPKIDRAKTAYIGNKRSILRIVFTLLPAVTLFLPLIKIGGNTHNIISIYKLISEKGFDVLTSDTGLLIPAVAAAVSVVMILICMIFLIASLGKHGKGRTIALYCVMAASAIISLITLATSETAAPSFGAYIYTGLQLWSCIWNYLLIRSRIEVKYTPCLIGGLPSDTYFEYTEQGMPRSDIRRKMLIALTEQQIEFDKRNKKNVHGEVR